MTIRDSSASSSINQDRLQQSKEQVSVAARTSSAVVTAASPSSLSASGQVGVASPSSTTSRQRLESELAVFSMLQGHRSHLALQSSSQDYRRQEHASQQQQTLPQDTAKSSLGSTTPSSSSNHKSNDNMTIAKRKDTTSTSNTKEKKQDAIAIAAPSAITTSTINASNGKNNNIISPNYKNRINEQELKSKQLQQQPSQHPVSNIGIVQNHYKFMDGKEQTQSNEEEGDDNTNASRLSGVASSLGSYTEQVR